MQSLFEILFVVGNPGKISKGKSFSKGNLSCLISGTESRKELKFGEVALQMCENV